MTQTTTCERLLDGRFLGCHSFSDIDMANVMLNHREHHCYYNPVDMQDISDEDDEATSLPIERVPSRFGAAADREIVDVDTLEQKAIDDNTAFAVRGLVIEKVRTDAPENNKRKHPVHYSPAKRLPPLVDTPQPQNPMGEKRDILRLSNQKLREVQHPQSCLRRFVLVNNTLR